MAYSDEVLADSPLSYWRLEETSGSTVADEQGVRAGTVTGVDLNVSGQEGSAGSFDGTDDYIDVGTTPSTMSAVTVEAIIKTAVADNGQIICADETTSDNDLRGWQFRVNATTGLLNFTKIANGVVEVLGTTDLTDDEFHHVAATYDGTTIRVYVDGVEEGSDTSSGNVATRNHRLMVGRNDRGATNYFTGIIDEPAFYDTALSAARIEAHYDAAFAAAGVTGTLAVTQADQTSAASGTIGAVFPDAPPNVTAVAQSDTEILVSWDAVSGADAYDVERDSTVVGDKVSGLSFSDTGLSPSTQYSYRVRAARNP